jgi:hypothetical protein
MKRATELFTFDEKEAASPFVSLLWQTRSESEGTFMSVAGTQWEIVVARLGSGTSITFRGPETRATPAAFPADAEFFGIRFGLGTFMPSLGMARMADRSLDPPLRSDTSFWFDGEEWELPQAHNTDVFVEHLERAGLLVHDPVASAALDDGSADHAQAPRRVLDRLSTRTIERRVRQATGLTRGTIRQIRRADRAVELLSSGVPTADVVERAGYADQPHLTRSLQRFVGQTPTRVAAGASGG